MPHIRVLEVATFYTMFNLEPVGRLLHPALRHDALPLARRARPEGGLRRRASARSATSRADGKFSWLEVECLGACCNAPMVQINDDYYEDLTPENLRASCSTISPPAAPVKTGPQNGRHALRAAGRRRRR